MRNEIFNRINQNRIQYYSELNNDKTETKIDLGSFQNEKIIINEDSKKTDIQSNLLQVYNRSKNSLPTLVFKNIRQQLSNLTSQAKNWIVDTHIYFANKAAIQSNKLTDGLTRISSQLFEDRYEYHQQTEKPVPMNQITGYQSIALGIKSTSGITLSVPYEAVNVNLHDQFFTWLNKIYRNIILFLESDDWFEEINQSQKSTISALEKHETVSHNSNIAKFRLFISGISKKGVQHHSMSDENTVTSRNNGKDYYRIFIRQFKNLSANLFHSINRFI